MGNCIVISAGDIDDFSILKSSCLNSYIICADGGYIHASKAGIYPDVVIGDFDTFVGELPTDIERIRYPSEKDDTDTMLAIKLAIDRGYKDITIFGATGGRFDHTYANIQALAYATEYDCTASIVNGGTTIKHIKNDSIILPSMNGIFSIFAYSDICEGVTITGAKYLLDKATVTNTFAIGTSNEFIGSDVGISVRNGSLLIVITKSE
ncbi:MAG: thiamine diphosphokinase [Clostridiales bacterium]|nr:thiamine diphosphokinase [Clostridiales bacterium]